jgi:hypothetical protein
MVRNGTRTVGYSDVRDGAPLVLRQTLQRHACHRCGLDYEEPGPALRPGYRMTEAHFARVAAEATLMPFLEVASRHGIHRETVSRVWSDWILERQALAGRPPECLVRTVHVGRHRFLLTVNREGRVLAAFDRADETLASWLRGSGTVMADMASAGLLMQAGLSQDRLIVRRREVVDWIEDALPVALKRCHGRMSRDGRQSLLGCGDALLKPPAARSQEEEAAVADASRTHSHIREISARISGLRRTFAPADPALALTRFVAWADFGTAFSTTTFGDVASTIDTWRSLIFTPAGWALDGLYPHRTLRVPGLLDRDVPSKAVGRIFAMNHDGTAAALEGIEMVGKQEDASALRSYVSMPIPN